MKKILAGLTFAALLFSAPAAGQSVTAIGASGPCTAFGTTSGTCVQGAGAGGTPSSINLSNGTALPIASGVSGLGTGIATALGVNTGSAGAPVLFNGAGGTPSSLTGTNITGTASGLTAGTASAVAVGGITGLGTGNATALGVNSGSAGAPVLLNGALGTPSSGVATNLTGIPAANLSGVSAVANGGTGVSALPNWSIYLNSNQTGIVSATYTVIAFDTKLFDVQVICDVVTNKGRCTPNKAGKYRVSGTYDASGTLSATGGAYCSIYKNGARQKEWFVAAISTSLAGAGCTGLIDMNGTTDYLELDLNVTTTASTVTAIAGASSTYFDGEWVGP